MTLVAMHDNAPHLFDIEPVAAEPDSRAAKSAIDKVLKVRRSLSHDEQRFILPRLNMFIDELRSLMRATPTQAEEMILYAIEIQGATTETEIAEDTRLHRSIVKQIVASLAEKGIVYTVSRTVIGSGRPQFAIKSRRMGMPEAD